MGGGFSVVYLCITLASKTERDHNPICFADRSVRNRLGQEILCLRDSVTASGLEQVTKLKNVGRNLVGEPEGKRPH